MNRMISSLNVIDVASPCSADWDAMTGDERVRHCRQCDMNVYNLSEMPEDKALKLVNEREGRLCIQFYRRADGTMITKDCPVGLRAIRKSIRQKVVRIWAKAAALTGAFLVSGLFGRSVGAEVVEVKPPDVPPEVIQAIKGQICVTPQVPQVPQIQLTFEGLRMMPAETLKGYLKKCLAKEEQASYRMPDPENKNALEESVRQTWQAKVDDASYMPQPGSQEHDALAKLTSAQLKKHSDIAMQIMAPLLRPHLEPIRGRMIVRPDIGLPR